MKGLGPLCSAGPWVGSMGRVEGKSFAGQEDYFCFYFWKVLIREVTSSGLPGPVAMEVRETSKDI